MIIFGGQTYRNQIIKVDICGFEWLGLLDFDFKYGACDIDSNQRIYLRVPISLSLTDSVSNEP